jgi:hypothetical protein
MLFFVAKIVGALLIVLILSTLGFLFYRDYLTQHDKRADTFAAGHVPSPELNGFLKGSAGGKEGTWRGKKFNASAKSGVNIFQNGNSLKEQYPFRTSTGKSAVDQEVIVLKIDYNLPQNPLWLRPVLDEVVQVRSGQYLGKLELRLVPGITVAVGYFELRSE